MSKLNQSKRPIIKWGQIGKNILNNKMLVTALVFNTSVLYLALFRSTAFSYLNSYIAIASAAILLYNCLVAVSNAHKNVNERKRNGQCYNNSMRETYSALTEFVVPALICGLSLMGVFSIPIVGAICAGTMLLFTISSIGLNIAMHLTEQSIRTNESEYCNLIEHYKLGWVSTILTSPAGILELTLQAPRIFIIQTTESLLESCCHSQS